MSIQTVRALLLGLAVGDALAITFRRSSRFTLELVNSEKLAQSKSESQNKGVWSDDAALSFCLAEMLCGPWDLEVLAKSFISWKDEGYWSTGGVPMALGEGTGIAIDRLKNLLHNPTAAGLRRERDNGNGSLVRILPLILSFQNLSPAARGKKTGEVSSLTHAHRRAVLACIFCAEFAFAVFKGMSLHRAYNRVRNDFAKRYANDPEISHFTRLLKGDLAHACSKDIRASAYVVDSLESVIWSLLASDSYREACLASVRLGGGSDSATSLVGGIAGLAYGVDGIPQDWLAQLARHNDIEDLALRLAKAQNLYY